MLIFVRHAQSRANAQGLLAGRFDVALTDRGRGQARSLAGVLSGVERLVSSPLERARDTASLALPELNIEIDDAFIEQDYGTHEGRKMSDVPREEWEQFRGSHDVALGGGESLADVDVRVHARLAEIFEEHAELVASPERHLVIVSHVTPIKSAVVWALEAPGSATWRMRLDNASLTTIGRRESGAYLVGYNDVSAWRESAVVTH